MHESKYDRLILGGHMKIWALIKPYLVVFLASLLVVSAIILNMVPLFGVDGYFHYNRIYEAAMQIKHQNFSFLNLYSFQEAGRIVSQVYSPLFGYVPGALLLLTGSWFKFQVLNLLIVMTIAGTTMYIAAKRLDFSERMSLALGVIYLTVNAISTYILTVGWKAIGLAFLPLLFISMVDMVEQRWNIKSAIALGIFVAIQAQGHPLNAVFVLPALIPFFVYGFFKATYKLETIKYLAVAILVALLLSLNAILPYLELSENTVIPPVKIDVTSGIFYPFNLFGGGASVSDNVLSIFALFGITSLILYWKKLRFISKSLMIIGLTYFVLGSNLTPWPTIQDQLPMVKAYLQFTFRFTMVGEAFVLVGTASIIKDIAFNKATTEMVTTFLAVVSVISLATSVSGQVINNRNPATTLASGTHTNPVNLILHKNPATGKPVNSMNDLLPDWYGRDLSQLIRVADRDTPDYVPVTKVLNDFSYYEAYKKNVVAANSKFTKKVLPHGILQVTWHQKENGLQKVPVFAYHHTKLLFNGQKLNIDTLKRDSSGVIKVSGKSGVNKLSLSYRTTPMFKTGIIASYWVWIITVIYSFLLWMMHLKNRLTKSY